MHQKENGGSPKRVAVKKTKTKTAKVDPLVTELLATVRQLQADQAKVVEQVLISQQKQSEMMMTWFGMFKAPEGQNQSTGLNQRLLAKEETEQNMDWEPLSPEEMLEVVKMVGTG